MPTIDDYEEKFQERVEEMYVLAKRLDERADDLKQAALSCQSQNEQKMEEIVVKTANSSEIIEKTHTVAAKIGEYIDICVKHVTMVTTIFFGGLLLTALVLVGDFLWTSHAKSQVDAAREEVAELQVQIEEAKATLGHKPLFLTANGSLATKDSADYVRVEPDSEKTMTHKNGKDYPGIYAKIWHQDNS